MDEEIERKLHNFSGVAVIREVYDNKYSEECFLMELEKALHARYHVIIIEPRQLGHETASWISFGNCLHKTAVLAGITSIFTGLIWPKMWSPQASAGVLSFVCTGLYTVSWQFDHCVKYQVEPEPKAWARIAITKGITQSSPIVLIRKDDTRRKVIHCSVTLAAAALCVYRFYRTVKEPSILEWLWS